MCPRSVRRRLLVLLPALAALLASCGRDGGWTRLELEHLRNVQLRLPDEQIFEIASAPDGAVFVSTFGGDVYRRRAAGGKWSRVLHLPIQEFDPPLLQLHAFSERSFIGIEGSRAHRWREGQPLRQERLGIAADSVHCGDFTPRLTLYSVWGPEDDTYAVGGHGVVAHYRDGAWRREPNPVSAWSTSPCYGSAALLAVGPGADGWVYAAGTQLIRTRGDGRWETVPGPGAPADSVQVSAITRDARGPLVAARPAASKAEDRLRTRFYRPGGRAGEWREVGRMAPAGPYLDDVAAHPGGPVVFWGWEGLIAVLDEGRVRRGWWYPATSYRVRGAVPVGDEVWIAINDGPNAFVVRLPR
jgi:hypothetical protein